MNINYIKNYVPKEELDKANLVLSTCRWNLKERQRPRTGD